MSHEIALDQKTGEHAMFARKEVPWHGLGQIVETAPTSEEAIKLAHLDYTVEKFPVFTEIEGLEEKIQVPEKFATVRTDTNEALGVVGSRYHVVQNTEAFSFIDNIVGSKEAIFETAGALGIGERIFITAKLPNNIRVKDSDDIIEQYILFTNGHDGAKSLYAGFTPIRVVCNNTLNAALGTMKNKLEIRHTLNAHNKMKQGLELLNLQRRYSMEFQDAINQLASVRINDSHIEKVVDGIYLTKEERTKLAGGLPYNDVVSTRKRNIMEEMTGYIETGVGQELHRGTAFWLWNGVTSYLSNGKEYRDEESRFKNIFEGNAQMQSQKAFNMVLDF